MKQGLTFADRYGFTGELVEVADGKVTPIGPVPTNNNSAVKKSLYQVGFSIQKDLRRCNMEFAMQPLRCPKCIKP